MREKNVRQCLIIPQILLVVAGGFLVLLGLLSLLSLLNSALMEEDKYVASTSTHQLLYMAGIALFGVVFLLIGILFKKGGTRKFAIFIIISMLYLFFFAGFMYYNIFIQPPQINSIGDSDNSINPIMNYIYFGVLLLIQVVPIIVIGVFIKRYEKRIRLENEHNKQ